MEHQETTQPVPKAGKPKTAGEYSRILDTAKLGVIGFLLDEALSILWANDYFYKKTGYSKEDYHNCFQTIRQYYTVYPKDFESLKNRLVSAMEKDEPNVELTARMPQKGGDFAWVHIAAAFAEKNLDTGCAGYEHYSLVWRRIFTPNWLHKRTV